MAVGCLSTGCSIKKMAINRLGDALASGGTTFSSDDDPDLVKAAVPFSLKLMESLLAESPKHKGLLFATSSGFTQYAYAFVQQDADEMEDKDLTAAQALRARARRLYLRARNYGLRGLDVSHSGFEKMLRANPQEAVRVTRRAEPNLVAEIPIMEALIDRALELDESFGDGAIHSFLITYEMSRQGAKGEPADRARKHFERAMELARGLQAGPLVSLAEAVSVQKQDLKEFDALLNRALAIDADAHPEYRLVNLVMQRRARWLLSRREELFLIPETPPGKEK
jgi:predicted anti-sigma-YlaC factor YlaD